MIVRKGTKISLYSSYSISTACELLINAAKLMPQYEQASHESISKEYYI